MTRTIPEPDLNYLQKVLLEMLAIPSPTGFTDTIVRYVACLLYTSPSPRDRQKSRMPSSA